jgi:DNA-binding CsgD family transcriptional regulator
MDDDRFGKLTERQRECLRLVFRGFEVKEIARELDLSPTAVVERLRGARRALGVESSREAARLLAGYENSGVNMRHVDTPQPVADIPYPLSSAGASQDMAGSDGPTRLQEVSAPFIALTPAAEPQNVPWPWRRKGARSNDLTLSQRFLASGGLTIAIALSVAIILIAVVELMGFLIQISRHGG